MDLRYPIGPFKLNSTPTREEVKLAIEAVAEAPIKLRAAVEALTPEQLDTPYRPGGWTVRQVVHHVPDSHLNSYCRVQAGADGRGTHYQGLSRRPMGGA